MTRGPARAAWVLAGLGVAAAVSAALVLGRCRSGRPHGTSANATPAPSRGTVGPGSIIAALDEQGAPITVRIDAIGPDPQDHDGDVFLHQVSVGSADHARWRPYCAPDAEGVAKAIPVSGAWDATGAYHDQPHLVTFACTSGAIAKCIRWGYKPWKTVRGTALRNHHQACVRLVRAVYCGDGRAHTRDGTRIDVFDPLGIKRPEPPDRAHPLELEAGWAPDGATYLNVSRWSDDVADIVRECPGRFAGRTSRAVKLTAEQVVAAYPETLVLNARFVRPQDRLAK